MTKPALAELVKKYLNSNNITELTGAALKTWQLLQTTNYSYCADEIGVTSSMIQRLQLLELIKENGRLDVLPEDQFFTLCPEQARILGQREPDQLPELDEEKTRR